MLTKGKVSAFRKLCQLDRLRVMNKLHGQISLAEMNILRDIYEADNQKSIDHLIKATTA